jgi:hypothetical protein
VRRLDLHADNNSVNLELGFAGYCPDGRYAATVGSTTICTKAPAGYYKPRVAFSDNYYVCANGTYSTSGASSCSSCALSSSAYASTSCVASCEAGAYSSTSGVCVLAPIGSYVSARTSNCSSAVYAGAAICQSTQAYVSSVAGGRNGTGGLYDGTGTNVYFNTPTGVAVDSTGVVYVADEYGCTIRMITTDGIDRTVTFFSKVIVLS